MTLEKHIEKFGDNFVSIPVKDIKYWEEYEMYIGNVVIGDKIHPKGSTIGFEFFDDIGNNTYIAYKPLNCYRRN